MRPVGFSWSRTQSPAGVKACRNHAAVVEHQQVALPQICSKTREKIVAQSACSAIHHQHAAHAAFGRRLLRDQLRGQIVVEVFNSVARSFRGLLKVRERPQPRAFNGGVEFFALLLEVVFGEIPRDMGPARPTHDDPREWFRNQKSIPRIASSTRAPVANGRRRCARRSNAASLMGPILVR